MSTTTVPIFEGTPTLDDEKVDTLKCWLAETMGDMDKATEYDASTYYEGYSSGIRNALELLYNMKGNDDDSKESASK